MSAPSPEIAALIAGLRRMPREIAAFNTEADELQTWTRGDVANALESLASQAHAGALADREALARVVCDARMKCGWPNRERLPRGFIDATDEQIADAVLAHLASTEGR